MEDVIGAIVNKVLALRTKRTRCIWNRVVIVVFSSTTSCTWRGLTVEFFSFLAMAALGNWVGVKHGRSGVIEQVSSCRARNTKGSSVVVLMLCFTGRANAAIAGSIRRLCTFDAEEALVEVGVESGRSGVIEQVSSGWARNTKGSSIVALMLCFTRGANAAVGGAMGGLCTFDAEEALVEVIVLREGGGVVQKVASSGAVGAGRGGAWLIGICSNWANGAGSFSSVGVSTYSTVGTLRSKPKSSLSRVGAGRATFALNVGSNAYLVGISTC